jgi:hypothetical protein
VLHLIEQVHAIDTEKLVVSHALPEVFDRLLTNDEARPPRANRRSVTHHRPPRKSKGVRQIRRVVSLFGGGPDPTHYQPNFAAVLSAAPRLAFSEQRHGRRPMDLDGCTMGQMVNAFLGDVRGYNFTKQKPQSDPVPAPAERLPSIPPKEPANPAWCGRFTYLRNEPGPAPTDYEVPTSTLRPGGHSFDGECGRPPQPQLSSALRSVGEDIDRTLPRSLRVVPFAKQTGRAPPDRPDAHLWAEIEAEQRELASHFAKPPAKTPPAKKARDSFALQTPQPSHPFAHCMRDEVDAVYDVDASRRALDRPATGFDIRQPVFKSASDRLVGRRSEAPDVMYDQVMQQFENTQPRATSPLQFRREIERRDPYHYFPHGCGRGDHIGQTSTVIGKPSVDIRKMTRRKTRLEVPKNFKHRVKLYSLRLEGGADAKGVR